MLVAVVKIRPMGMGVFHLFVLVPVRVSSRSRKVGMYMSVMIVVMAVRMLMSSFFVNVNMVMLITE